MQGTALFHIDRWSCDISETKSFPRLNPRHLAKTGNGTSVESGQEKLPLWVPESKPAIITSTHGRTLRSELCKSSALFEFWSCQDVLHGCRICQGSRWEEGIAQPKDHTSCDANTGLTKNLSQSNSEAFCHAYDT